MGIHCEINLNKRNDSVFRSGSIVAGVVKYAVDEETQFKAITVSLKGKGFLHVKKIKTSDLDQEANYYRNEDYVDTDNVIVNDEKVPLGSYEIQFSFELPYNIPSSFDYFQIIPNYHITCNIAYYIRIKFERRGFMKRAKHFRKEIKVVSELIPRLPTVPCVFGERKTLTQLFAKNKNINLKATIDNSVITSLQGAKIKCNYELTNDSNITINSVKVKLLELYKFFLNDKFKIEYVKTVKDTDSKTGSIKKHGAQVMDIEITVPSDVQGNFEFAKIISREYRVVIKVKLPMPHRNMFLKIPVQIGNQTETNFAANGELEPPPSYWEAMTECNDDVEKEKNNN